MTAKTRTATRPAAQVVEDAIASNSKYVTKAPTTNLAGFSAYAVSTLETPFKTKAETEAFILGNKLAGLRAKWQNDRRTSKIAMTVTFEDYCVSSSGVEVKSDNERIALLAGIATYKNYVNYRDARKAGKLNADGSVKAAK